MSDPRAELNAIVVDQSARGTGIGRALIKAAEEWARSRNLTNLRLGARTTRTETHEFYKKTGFSINKTWLVFQKEL